MDNLEIKEFDYDLLPEFGTTLFVSSRKSGKSVMARDILYYFIRRRKLKRFIIISATMRNNDYAFLGEGAHVTRMLEFNDKILKDIIDDQHRRMDEDIDSPYTPVVILMDDLIKSTDQRTKDAISRCWCTLRHGLGYAIMITQSFRYECSIPVVLNSDVVVLFSSRNIENKKMISSLFLGFTDKNDRNLGYELIDKIAVGYRALVIVNTSKSPNINEIVYYKELDLNKSVPNNYIFQG